MVEEIAIRDAVLLTAAGDDPGPAGKLFLATRMLTRQTGAVGSPLLKEQAELIALRWGDVLAAVPDLVDSAIQSGRTAPFAVADLITAIFAVRPDVEVLALGLADVVFAHKLNWPRPVPLLLPGRFGPAFRTTGGRGRVQPGSLPIQKRSVWRWSTASARRCGLRRTSIAGRRGCWLCDRRYGPKAPRR